MKKSQGVSMNVVIVASIALLVLVVLIAIFSGSYGIFGNYDNTTYTEQPVWKNSEMCVGYYVENINRTMTANEIVLSLYNDYLYENHNAKKFEDIALRINEESLDVLNITYSVLKYDDGKSYNYKEDLVFPCVKKIKVLESENI